MRTSLTANTYSLKGILPVIITAIVVSFIFYKGEILVPVVGVAVSFGLLAILAMIRDIKWGFYFLLFASFISIGLTRYLPLPLGLLIDVILAGIFFIYFLKEFKEIDWSVLKNPAFFAVFAWMIINCMEIVNPESHSFEAWFYAMRGVSLYLFLSLIHI